MASLLIMLRREHSLFISEAHLTSFCQTVGLREEDAELLDSRTLGKLSSYIDLPTRLG
jgi:hypothetical protein